ncbi:MAG: hypothetical protein LBR38_02075 [Synergistaceae bacterium]|jgi:hypothetical protein|nr:hypothetical protein [Synergistaceae bacterium]
MKRLQTAFVCALLITVFVPAAGFAGGSVDSLVKELDGLVATATAAATGHVPAGDIAAVVAPIAGAKAIVNKSGNYEMMRGELKGIQATQDSATFEPKVKGIYSLADSRLTTRMQNEVRDHGRVSAYSWEDLTGKITSLYSLLGKADALSFVSSGDFDASFDVVYPGTSGSKGDNFAAAYKNMMAEWQDYLYAAIKGNNTEALDARDSRAALIKKLDLLSYGTGAVLGYAQAMFARRLVYVFIAQEAARLRLDVIRHIELRARYAALRQQRRTDRVLAFEKARGTWQTQTSGKSY